MYAIVSFPQAHGTILDIYIENCIFVNVIVSYFVFSAVFIEEGQNLNNFFHFLALYMLVCVNKFEIIKYNENINVFAFVFFHTILTVAQSTWMTIVQYYLSANSVYLVIYNLCITHGGCFVHP